MEQACHIAESAAKAAGIDAMRVDIFLKKGNPAAAQINENSLSSAADYQWHTPYLAKAWQEGHLAATSQIVDPGNCLSCDSSVKGFIGAITLVLVDQVYL